jgi:hypothetical protein
VLFRQKAQPCFESKTVKQTPWIRFLPEKLIVSQLVKKFHALYELGRIIAGFTRAYNLSIF